MPRRRAFTLVELMMVVVIIGILAAVAIPRMMNTSREATENGLRETLRVVRNAIDMYSAHHGGTLPGLPNETEAKFKADIGPYLRGPFPVCPVGPAQNDLVRIDTGNSILDGELSPSKGWVYKTKTGKFGVNYKALSLDKVRTFDRF